MVILTIMSVHIFLVYTKSHRTNSILVLAQYNPCFAGSSNKMPIVLFIKMLIVIAI
jgi:hypothetical protein